MENLYSNKRILVYGAGAIGSYYGAFMAKGGLDITLVTRGAHLKKIQENSTVRMNSREHGQFDIKVNAADKPDGIYDVIFVCVKSHDTLEACTILKNHSNDDTAVVSFQNGVDNTNIMKQLYNEDNIIACSLYIGVRIDPPGTIFHTSYKDITCGAVSEGGKKHLPLLKYIFDKSEFKYNFSDDIKYVQWKKLVWNVAYNPLSALLESVCGKMRKNPEIADLMDKMVMETVKAASLDGVIIEESVWKDVIAHRDTLNDYKTSMLQDIENGRSPEIDGILGPVIRMLKAAGEEAPYCDTVYRALKFKFGGWFLYCPRLAADVIVRKGDSVLLIERKNEPYGWAIPGGFVDYGEKVEDAAKRELLEETGLSDVEIELLGIYSDPKRDKRGHVASAVYYTKSEMPPVAGDDAADAKFFRLDNLPENIAFDHKQILDDYIKKTGI